MPEVLKSGHKVFAAEGLRQVVGLPDARPLAPNDLPIARDGDRAFFVLPTTWTGKAHGRSFSEEGGWAFVLEETYGRWRILSYAWAVTSKG